VNVVRSMTGYGRAELETPYGRLSVQIKTLNHKYRSVSCRLPHQLSPLEIKAVELISSRIARGTVYLNVDLLPHENASSPKEIFIDLELARRYKEGLEGMGRELGAKGEVELQLLASLPGVVNLIEPQLEAEEVWRWLEEAMNLAIDRLDEMRLAEGERMRREMERRLASVAASVDRIERLAEGMVDDYREKLRKRMKELLGEGYDEGRISMEAALMAERSDISEEIARLRSHISQFSSLLGSAEPVGKQLDFLLQEMHRESNTIAAKATREEIVSETIKLRSEIDKIREIAQNVE